MSLLFNFGESVDGFDYKVINERDARASAGIMFLLGLLSLFSVYLLRTLLWAELFSITFIFEFFVRTVISPKYAPYMLLGGLIVSNQEPEWVDAKPKQFAWILGMILGVIMTYYIVFDLVSWSRFYICIVCLILMFLESVFGICLGCLLYQKLNIGVQNCPGGICDNKPKHPYGKKKIFFLLFFIALFVLNYFALDFFKYSHVQNYIIVD